MKRWFLLITLLAGTILLSACASVFATEPEADGRIEVVMHDNRYEPQVIRVKAGQTVEIVLRNEGTKLHEFMIGRDVHVEGKWTEGFATDFFTGLDLQIDGPGMVMGLPGEMEGMDMGGGDEHAAAEGEMDMGGDEHAAEEESMDMDAESSGMDMGDDEHTAEEESMEMGAESSEMDMDGDEHAAAEESMDMSGESAGMDMGGDEHAAAEGGMDMAPADEHGADEHGEGDFGEFGAFQISQLEAGHSGVMVMIDPTMIPASETTVIRMTIPADRVGTWTFGCFQERGQHFDDGMHGTFIVEP
jgi:hypothetical protein